jgi:flavin-dependent dehydrogenase
VTVNRPNGPANEPAHKPIHKSIHKPKRIVVIGASVSGLATAALLRKSGHEVQIVEQDDVPDCETPREAFERWNRKGAPQVNHAHAFLGQLHKLIRQHAPELLDRLLEHGADELRFPQMIPPSMATPEFIESDDEITMIACRRITFEWVLRRYVLSDLGVSIDQGTTVLGLVSDEQRGGIPVVRGVRVENAAGDTREIAADLVVDASGRRSKIGDWLVAIGCKPIRTQSEPCGIVYSCRFYQLAEGAERPFTSGFAGGDLGYLRYGVFPCDSGLYSLICAASPEDRSMRLLQRPEGFEAAMRELPLSRDWLGAGLSEPVTDVHTMAGLRNVRRFFVEDGQPMALGFQPVGDALCHSNPLLGRGCTYGWMQAQMLREAIDARPDDLLGMALDFDAKFERAIVPGYEFVRSGDRTFIERERGLREGREPAEPDTPEEQQRFFLRGLIRDGFVPAMASDINVLRAFMRVMNLLDPMDAMMKDPTVLAAVMKAYGERETRVQVVDGPSRDDMIALLQGAAAA